MVDDREHELRVLLAEVWMYGEPSVITSESGEYQDHRHAPMIDFLRETPATLRLKMAMHAAARHATAK